MFSDEMKQFFGSAVIFESAFGLQLQQRAQARKIGSRSQVSRHDSKVLNIFFRQVDAAEIGVLFYIANDVGELKGQAHTLGERLGFGIRVPKDSNADEAHD